MEKKEFYTVAEVAEMYGLKEGTIRTFINRGQLNATKFNKRSYMITPAQIEEWEATRKPRKRVKKHE